MAIKDNIKKYRELQRLTIPALADKMGIDKAGIYKWEDGTTVPGGKKLTELAQALNVTVNDLLGEKPTYEQNEAAIPEKALGEMEAFKKLVEGGTEYLLVPRTAFEGAYRFVPVEQINNQTRELEIKAQELKEKNDQIQSLTTAVTDAIKQLLSGRVPQLSKVEEAQKNTTV